MGRCALDRIPQTGAGFCVQNALERLSTGALFDGEPAASPEDALAIGFLAGKRRIVAPKLGIKQPCLRRGAAPLAQILDAHDRSRAHKRDRDHVADRDRLRGIVDALAVDADVSALNELCRERPRFREPREPQPFVEALAVSAHPASRQRHCLSPSRPSSWAFRTSSLANGELGSGGRRSSRDRFWPRPPSLPRWLLARGAREPPRRSSAWRGRFGRRAPSP